MVKFEQFGGGTAFVLPNTVVGVRSSVEAGFTVLDRKDLSSIVVKGTPDEVHAKLFPALTASSLALVEESDRSIANLKKVFEWLLGEDGPAYLPAWVAHSARKALGREG